MDEIKVLIIDDSSVVHLLLEKAFAEHKDIVIAGDAYDGKEGIELAAKLSPDVIIMDIEMPRIGGLEAIKEIMDVKPTPIIVFSSASRNTINLGFKAIELGAVELIEKPYAEDFNLLKNVIDEKLIKSIRTFSGFKVIRMLKHLEDFSHNKKIILDKNIAEKTNIKPHPVEAETISEIEIIPKKHTGFPVIGIAASTGGPQTIKKLLHGFPIKELGAGVVIVQHMADGFINGFCDWLNEQSPVKIKMAEEMETISSETIYIAPEGHHLVFDQKGRFSYLDAPTIMGIRPSADLMIDSLGKVFKDRVIVIILTGMGGDGSKGLAAVKENGGYIIAQDEESSLIFGMPKVAIETGYVDKVLSLNQISEFLLRLNNERFDAHS